MTPLVITNYRRRGTVAGYVDGRKVELALMISSTGKKIYAVKHNWGQWQEITHTEFVNLAQSILDDIKKTP